MEYLNSLEAAASCGMTLAYHAQQAPDRLAVASQFGDRSFSELNARANQVVRRLREAGLGTDDSVAMLLVNRPEFLEVLFACQRGGLRILKSAHKCCIPRVRPAGLRACFGRERRRRLRQQGIVRTPTP